MAKKKQPARVISSFDELDASGIGAGYTPYAVQEDEQTAPAPESSGLIRRIAGDGILTAVKGFIGVPEAAVGLADMASGGHVGKALENGDGAIGFRPKQAKEYLDQFYSPEQKAAFAAVQNAANKDDPFLTRVGDIAGAAIRNPSTIVHAVGESLPSIGAGGLAARGVLAGATAMSPAIAAARAAPFVASQGARSSLSMAQLAAAGAGEGIVSAGSTAEQIRQGTKDGLMTGEQSLIAAGSGIATMGIGMVAAKAAKSLGVGDIDTLLLGGKHVDPALQKGFVRQLLEGAVTEGVMEELPQSVQEQVAQNYALGKPLDEGVDHAAVMGVLTGGAMGVGAQVMHRTQPVPEVGPLSKAANVGIAATGPIPVEPPPMLLAPEQEQSLLALANTRNQELTDKANGTKDVKTKAEDGTPVTIPGKLKQFLTPAEKEEQAFLAQNGGDVQALAQAYPGVLAQAYPGVLAAPQVEELPLAPPVESVAPAAESLQPEPFDTDAAIAQYRAETLAAQQAEADRVAYEQHHAQLDQAIEPPSVDELFPLPSAPEVATLPPSPAAPTEPVAQTPPANDAAPTVASKPVDIKHPTTGKSFTTKPGAMKAQKLAGDGHEVVKVDGGFVVRAKDTNGTSVQAPGLDQQAATGSSDKPGGSGVTPVVEPANGRTGELQNSHGPDTSSGQTAPVSHASAGTDSVAPGGNSSTAADENPEWTRMPHADRLALNTRAGMSKLVADKIARTPWADITPKTREKITAAMAAPVRSSEIANAPVTDKPDTQKITTDKAEMRPYRKPDGSVGYEAVPIVEDKHAAPAIPKKLTVYRAENSGRGIKTDAIQGGTYYFDNKEAADLWAGDAGNVVEREIETSGASIQDVSEGELIHRGEPVLIRRDPEGSGKILEIVVFDKYKQKTTPAPAEPTPAATESVAKPDAKSALSEREKAAKAKMFNALGKLAHLAGKNTRMNWTQEEEQQLLPIVIELFDGAMELGAVTFQQAVAYVREFISSNLDQETADAIPFDTLQGAYISVAGRHKDKGVTSKKEVVSFESLAELENSADKAEKAPVEVVDEYDENNLDESEGSDGWKSLTYVSGDDDVSYPVDFRDIRTSKEGSQKVVRQIRIYNPNSGSYMAVWEWRSAKPTDDLFAGLSIDQAVFHYSLSDATEAAFGKNADNGDALWARYGREITSAVAEEKAQPASPAKTPLLAKPEAKADTSAKPSLNGPEGRHAIAQSVADHFIGGGKFDTIIQARKFISELTGEKIESSSKNAKLADETIEMGVVLAGREMVKAGRNQKRSDQTIYDRLVSLYNAQPNLSVRSSTSVEQQAYSTPIPLAFVASRLAKIKKGDIVAEPTAGNSALVLEVLPAHTVINELNDDRIGNLKAMGFTPTQKNAATEQLAAPKSVDAAVMNPPFGAVKDGEGKTIYFDVPAGPNTPALNTREIDHAIVFNSLATIKDDGRAVLIVGGVDASSEDQIREGYRGKGKREFYYKLYNEYKVTDHFTVDGGLYSRQGAGYPVDVIVIDGRGKSARDLPAANLPQRIMSYDQLKEKLNEANSLVPAGSGTGVRVDSDPARVSHGTDVATSSIGSPDVPGIEGVKPGASIQAGSKGDGVRPILGQSAGSGSVSGGGKLGATGTPTQPDGPARGGLVAPAGVSGESGRKAGNGGNRSDDVGGNSSLDGKLVGSGLTDRRGQEAETENQVGYTPKSGKASVGTLVPVNMRDAIQESLSKVADDVGDLDDYVAKALGYTSKELGDYLSAEQIDALALAIYNAEQGKGFIIGDQTGIGKGRVNAAMIRYAIKKGQVPIFITEKPNLYADMIRDLDDIGMAKDLDLEGGKPHILMTNNGESIPYELYRNVNGEVVEHKLTLKAPKSNAKDAAALLAELAGNGELGRYKVIFSTYSQLQSIAGKATERQRFLTAFAKDNFIIFDESHNAGGTGEAQDSRAITKVMKASGMTVPGRAGFARNLVKLAKGTFFSSATYAKRPDVMDLYSSTNMSLAVDKPADLATAIKAGGVPLQQAVATMLTADGQYIRRERTFAGVSYETQLMPIDRQTGENMAESMRWILAFSRAKEALLAQMQKEFDKDGAIAQNMGGEKTQVAGANFGSVMHNLIDQMLLALKVEESVKLAIAKLKAGEKVVLTVSNTMGSFLKDYADEMGIRPGDAVSLSFKDLYLRYLDKQRKYKVKSPGGTVEEKYLSDAELGHLLPMHNKIQAFIQNAGFGSAPISPIDYMHNELRKAGYKTDEITGRTATVDYEGGIAKLASRTANIKQRLKAIGDFNSGAADVLILNQSGSTGLSLHASAKFKDQKKRHMIIVQAEKNIDTHMQMLGRVHRTGQVVTPGYTQAMADTPAEMRPAAVLSKKMAGLSANTTASRKSAVAAEGVVDFINEYGGQVAAEFLQDNPEVHDALGGQKRIEVPSDLNEAGEELIRKLTGYIPILPLKQQEQIYADLIERYNDLIARENSMGTNRLETKALDLDAKTLTSEKITANKGSATETSVFAEPANMEQVDVKRNVKPLTPQELEAAINETLNGVTPQQYNTSIAKEFDTDLAKYVADVLEKMAVTTDNHALVQGQKKDQLFLMGQNIKRILSIYKVGDSVTITDKNASVVHGVITGITHNQKTKNPAAGSAWKMTFALANGDARTMSVGFGQLGQQFSVNVTPGTVPQVTADGKVDRVMIRSLFENGNNIRREKRWMVTGNLLAGFSKYQGQIVSYTKADGGTGQGVLMNRQFDYKKEKGASTLSFSTSAQAIEFLTKAGRNAVLGSPDRVLRIVSLGGDRYSVMVPSSKREGGSLYLDRGLLDAFGSDFYKQGQNMSMRIDGNDTLERGLNYLIAERDDVSLAALTNQDVARKVLGMDDAPKAVFSQGLNAPKSLGPKPTADQIQRLVDKVLQVAKNVVPVSIIGNPSQIHGVNVPVGTKPTGAVIDGRIYLFADNIGSVGSAYVTLFHEVFHLGLQKVIPAEDYAAMLKQFANSPLVAKYIRLWKDSAEGVQKAKTMPSQNYEALANEEALAMVSETLAANDGMGTKNLPGLAKVMLNWLAKVADRIGMPVDFSNWVRDLTRTEAERFVNDMVRAVLGGQKNLTKTQAKYGTVVENLGGVGARMSDKGAPLLAPNGKPSKLTPGQHAQVRTPQFKAWFGNWEAVARQGNNRAVIERALSDRQWQERTLIAQGNDADPSGKLSEAFGFQITKQYITPDDIRKTDKKHGEGHESFTDQIGLTHDDYVKMIEVLRDPQTYRITTSKNGKPSAEFGYKFSDGTYVVAEVEVSEANGVSLKTAWKKVTGRNHAGATAYPVRTTSDNAASADILHSDSLLVNPANVSKAVDENGEPLRLFHGTAISSITVFNGSRGSAGHFAFDPKTASGFAKAAHENEQEILSSGAPDMGDGGQVYPVYIKAKNIFDARNQEHLDAIGVKRDAARRDYEWLETHIDAIKAAGFDSYYDFESDLEVPSAIAAFNPTQIKSAIGNNGQFDPKNPDIRFSTLGATLTDGMNSVRDVGLPAGYKVADLFQGEGRLSYWHKSVGTMYNLAQRSPPFKRVFDSVQNFLNDVSFYAAEAADLAPSILPKLDKITDIAKSPLSAADTKALSRPVFEGTLTWGRDSTGTVKPMEEIEAALEELPLDERAHMLLQGRHVAPAVLRMWQGLPQDQYEAIINGKFEREFMKPGVVFKPAELREHFGMTDAQVALYQEFRKATDKSIDNLAISEMLNYAGKDAVAIRDDVLASGSVQEAGQTLRDYLVSLTEIEPERDEALSATAAKMLDIAAHATDMKDRGYAPLSRFGNYTLEATLPTGERYFSLFETDRERNKMARMLTSQGATGVSAGTMSQEAYKLLNGITPETAALFGEMLGLESQGSEAKDLAFQEYIKRGTANRSAMKRLLQRKGIAGFSEDSGRVLAGFIYSNSRRTSSNLHAKETTEAVSAIPKEQGELKDTAVKLHEYVSNPAEEAQAFRGILFAQYLGGSVASAMVNATQPFTVTLPYLTQFGGVKKAAAQMVAALRDATKDTTGNAALDAALKRAEEEGIVSPQEVHSLQAQAMGRAQLQAGDGTAMGNALANGNNAISKMSLAWGKVFGIAEQFNRRTTFIAAYRTAIEQGIANPAKFAEKAVVETQFVYNKGNKMRWGRGAIGATLFTFKQYSVNYLEMVHRMATAGEPGSPERAAGRKAAVLAIAILFMMAGSEGLPFVEDIEDVLDGAMQRLGYNFSSKQRMKAFLVTQLGKDGAEFVTSGVSGLPGAPIDVSGRLGMGNLIPGTGMFQKRTDHTRDLKELLGPTGDLATRAGQAIEQVLAGNVASAAKTIAPVAARNVIKAADMADTGMYRDDKGNKIISTDGVEAVAKAMGFQPRSVKNVQDATVQVQKAKAQYILASGEIRAKMAQAIFMADDDMKQSARDDVAAWNRNNPDQRMTIDMPAVLRKVREMRKTKEQRIADTAPKAVRSQVRQQLREELH